MESPRSPKRRRILASINPPEEYPEHHPSTTHKRDRTKTPEMPAPPRDDTPRPAPESGIPTQESAPEDGDATAPRPTKFRFKSKSSRVSRSRRDEDDDRHRSHHRHHRHHRDKSRSRHRDKDKDKDKDRDKDRHRSDKEDGEDDESARRKHRYRRDHSDPDKSNRRHRRHRRHHQRSRSRSRSRSPIPSPLEKNAPPIYPDDPPLSPTTAFRESLFDAMADDEGAAYWEAVYGQPVHIYSQESTNPATGMLERMTDEEYAEYVRRKMWEKTHAGLLEERARRERERKEREAREEEERRVRKEVERCLRRGEERRRKRGWRERWEGYLRRWREWEAAASVEIPWPEGAENRDGGGEVQRETVKAFFVNGIGLEELGEKEFAAKLKEERVRWHPDKIQQRLGGKVDEKIMRDVTAIFQVVDALWNDTRKNSA